jgi:hypothetical protein
VRPGALEKERLLPYKRPALKEAANKCRGMADSQNRLTKHITTSPGRDRRQERRTQGITTDAGEIRRRSVDPVAVAL